MYKFLIFLTIVFCFGNSNNSNYPINNTSSQTFNNSENINIDSLLKKNNKNIDKSKSISIKFNKKLKDSIYD